MCLTGAHNARRVYHFSIKCNSVKPNFDTLTLVGVEKSRNSADFSVSD